MPGLKSDCLIAVCDQRWSGSSLRLGQAVVRRVVSLPAASEAAEQQVDRRADCGLDVLFGLTPQRIHLHQVHPWQESCGTRENDSLVCTSNKKLQPAAVSIA